MENLIKQAARAICDAELTLALTGAGISVESGIPDFRSEEGLWSRYDPAEYATLSSFMRDPEKVWDMLREMNNLVNRAKPNKTHHGMSELEQIGFLHYIITQNIDNLHQLSGSRSIIEYHGNSSTLSCLWCNKSYSIKDKRDEFIPRCLCGKVLKPDIIFFEEAIPEDVLMKSFQLADSADTLMVVGTSAVVSPANTIPGIAKSRGAKIIEINIERTHLTDSVSDIFIQGSSGKIMEKLVTEVKAIAGF